MKTFLEARGHNLYNTLKFKESSVSRKQFLRRILPAIRHKESGKIYVGQRGEWHPLIAQYNGLDDYSYQDTTMAKGKYQRGFVDPLKKKFVTAWKTGLDAAELPISKIARMRMYGEENLDELKIAKLYTVAPADLPKGEDLKSMSAQFGKEEGEKRFKEKWQGELPFPVPMTKLYAGNVHLTRDALFAHYIRDYMSKHAGNKKMAIYDVRPSKKMVFGGEGGNIEMIKDRVPARYIRKRWNDAASKWENWNTKSFMEHLAESIGGAFLPTDAMATPETSQSGELVNTIERIPVPIEDGGKKVIVSGKKKLRQKTFKEHLNETPTAQFRPEYSPILHNPTISQLERQHGFATGGSLMDNPYGKHKELRYLADRKGKNIWTVDAAEMIHNQLATEVGVDVTNDRVPWTRTHYLGSIKLRDISAIKKHPKGLQGWINDRHKGWTSCYGKYE